MNASNVQPADQGICRDKIPDKGTLAIYSRTRSSNPNPLPQHAHRCTDAACGHLAPCVLIDTGYLLRRAPPLRDGVQAPCSNAVRATCKRNDARPYACERRCCALRLPLDRVPHRCCGRYRGNAPQTLGTQWNARNNQCIGQDVLLIDHGGRLRHHRCFPSMHRAVWSRSSAINTRCNRSIPSMRAQSIACRTRVRVGANARSDSPSGATATVEVPNPSTARNCAGI